MPYWDELAEQCIPEELDGALNVLEFIFLVVPSCGSIGGPDHVRELM
jgi:hypothetical protein